MKCTKCNKNTFEIIHYDGQEFCLDCFKAATAEPINGNNVAFLVLLSAIFAIIGLAALAIVSML